MVSFVRPSKTTSEKRELMEFEMVDGFIEKITKPLGHTDCDFLLRTVDQIEVPGNDPRASENMFEVFKALEKMFRMSMIRGSIHICDCN